MKYMILFSFLAMCGLSACSSGDGGPPRIAKCGRGWKLLDINRDAQETTDLSTTQPKLPAGRYDATSTSLYYWDKQTNVRMQLSSSLNEKTGEVKMDVECLSGTGVTGNMQPLKVSIPYVSGMLVDANGKTILSTRTMIAELRNVPGQPLLKVTSDEVSSGVQGSIKDTYAGYPNTAQFLYKLNDQSYETRTQLRADSPNKDVDESLEVRVSVSYAKDRVVPPKTEAAQAIQE